jgi:carbamoyltransferase
MRILGLSFGFHDSAAALVVDGQPVAAAQQERFSRKKNDAAFPIDAINACLARAGLSVDQLDAVVYHELPLLKFDRIVRSWIEGFPDSGSEFDRTVASWLRERRFDPAGLIAERLSIPVEKVVFCRHHQSHAASAFFASPFDRATLVTLDGVGEVETATIGHGDGHTIRQYDAASLPHSIGLFYSAFTAFLGFQVNEGEYKVMGMAAFGEPVYKDEMVSLFKIASLGLINLDQTYFCFGGMSDLPYSPALIERFGPPREPGSPFAVLDTLLPANHSTAQHAEIRSRSRHYANIAASVQACTEEVIRQVVHHAVARSGLRQVAMAGGVALNSLANGRLLREQGLDVFIQPAAGDAGCALGAALYRAQSRNPPPQRWTQEHSAFGPSHSHQTALEAANQSGFTIVSAEHDQSRFLSAVAGLLAAGHVVAWLEGRSEWGPRALGHRSILADPRIAEMQGLVNEKIKFREPFRPFAPAVPFEHADKFFEIGAPLSPFRSSPSAPESFMLAVHPVRAAAKTLLPAVTHADGTARVQFVHRSAHPVFHALLTEFGQQTGVPVLLNTSFNLNGEPIVESPFDAVRTFALSGIDYLCMEGVILSKKPAGQL